MTLGVILAVVVLVVGVGIVLSLEHETPGWTGAYFDWESYSAVNVQLMDDGEVLHSANAKGEFHVAPGHYRVWECGKPETAGDVLPQTVTILPFLHVELPSPGTMPFCHSPLDG
jgi:hypothetical protein